MIEMIEIRDRGVTPRGMRRQFQKAQAEAWEDTAIQFQREHIARRFTSPTHAREAGYTKRKGDELAWGSKAWRRSYMGIKWRRFKHQRALEFTGETRAAVSGPTAANIKATAYQATMAYPGARKLSFRAKGSEVRMQNEFRTVTATEAGQLAKFYDRVLDRILAANNDQTTTTI
jgi:hypothetical protein